MATTHEVPAQVQSTPIEFTVNGRRVSISTSPLLRLSRVLREELGLIGTKVGCDAGDCGACTVLVDGEPVCACLISAAQAEGHEVTTVEGLAALPAGAKLQQSFLARGAAQCGACTPGMLVSATALLAQNSQPTENEVMDAIGGVLCRCTGYRKIISAVLEAASSSSRAAVVSSEAGAAVGQRLARLDGKAKIEGTEIFGADQWPVDALAVRAIRCAHHRARFRFGDLDAFVRTHPGIHAVFTAKDVPGKNCFGVIPPFADQPVFAESEARFRGEAVAAVIGEAAAIERFEVADFPVTWEELPPLTNIDEALSPDAPRIHANREHNVLVRGRVVRGEVEHALRDAEITAAYECETSFVEHAYIEPEAGIARRVGSTIEIQ